MGVHRELNFDQLEQPTCATLSKRVCMQSVNTLLYMPQPLLSFILLAQKMRSLLIYPRVPSTPRQSISRHHQQIGLPEAVIFYAYVFFKRKSLQNVAFIATKKNEHKGFFLCMTHLTHWNLNLIFINSAIVESLSKRQFLSLVPKFVIFVKNKLSNIPINWGTKCRKIYSVFLKLRAEHLPAFFWIIYRT